MNVSSKVSRILANIYLFEVNKRNTKQSCEISSKLTTKTPELRQMELSEKNCFAKGSIWRRSGVFVVNSEHI